MSDAIETTATPEAPETTAPDASPANAADAASEAARTLAARRAEIKAKLAKGEGNDPKDSKPDGATDANAQHASAKDPKSADTQKTAAKADADDDLSALIKEQRRISAESKRIAAERAAIEAARKEVEEFAPRVKAAKEALAKGSKVDAIRALFPDEDLTTDLFWDLAKQLGEGEPAQPKAIDPEELAELAAAKLEAKRQAEEEARQAKEREAQEAQERQLSEARETYLSAVNETFQANAANYPGVVRLFKLIGDRANKVVSERIIELAEAQGRETGSVPSVSEVLAKVSQELYADAAQAAANDNGAARSAGTVTSAWKSDPGRPITPSREKTLEEIRAERKAALRAQR